jgi:hypothetical protein
MSVCLESLKSGLEEVGLKYHVPEANQEVCVVPFDGSMMVLMRIVGDGHLIYFQTSEMMNIASLSDPQQALIRCEVCNWNARSPVARISAEPGGEIIVENSYPIDEDSVLSPRLIATIVLSLVAAWKEKFIQLQLLTRAIQQAEQNASKPASRPPGNHRFGNFFSDN